MPKACCQHGALRLDDERFSGTRPPLTGPGHRRAADPQVKTTATCAGAGSMSATSRCRACWRWRSCAARWRTRASGRSVSRRRCASACSSPRTWRASSAIRADTTLPGFKSSRAAGPGDGQGALRRRAGGHVRGADAGRGRGPRRPRSSSTSIRCPSSSTCWQRAQGRARRWCTSTGATISISPPPSDVNFEAVKAKAARLGHARAAHLAPGHEPDRGARRGRAIGTRGWASSSSPPPPSSRTSCARASPNASGIDEGQIRVVSPDVGGGFGYKGILLPEEVALAWATRKVGAPLQVDRGPPREPDRQRQLPRAPLYPHRLRRRRRPAAGARLRGHRRFRRLLRLSVLRLPGGRPGRPRSCRASTTSRTTAAASIRWPPTSRRSCPTAASPAPACASRWR